MIQTVAQKATTEHKDLSAAYVCGALGAVFIRYVASVEKPIFSHLILAAIAACCLLAAYLFIAKSKASEDLKAGTIIGVAVVAGVCFTLVSLLL